jgi:hypothetical protein
VNEHHDPTKDELIVTLIEELYRTKWKLDAVVEMLIDYEVFDERVIDENADADKIEAKRQRGRKFLEQLEMRSQDREREDLREARICERVRALWQNPHRA